LVNKTLIIGIGKLRIGKNIIIRKWIKCSSGIEFIKCYCWKGLKCINTLKLDAINVKLLWEYNKIVRVNSVGKNHYLAIEGYLTGIINVEERIITIKSKSINKRLIKYYRIIKWKISSWIKIINRNIRTRN
jgi:hypothetical protein